MPINLGSEIYEVASVKVNGAKYKPNFAFYLQNNHVNDPVFGIIKSILINAESEIFFIYNEYVTIGFNDHVKAYLISIKCDAKDKFDRFDVNNYKRPINVHTSAHGELFISRRDLV